MHIHRLFLFSIIFVYEIKFSTTFQVSFSQDNENSNLINFLTKKRYKLVGIRLRLNNATDNKKSYTEIDKTETNQNTNIESHKTIEAPKSVAQNESEIPKDKKEKSILREGTGWTAVEKPPWIPPFPAMKKACEADRSTWIDDCPPGYQRDTRSDKEILAWIAETAKKDRHKETKDKPKWQTDIDDKAKDMTSDEERRKKRMDHDKGITTPSGVPRKCVPILQRGYRENMYVGFIHK